jgi:hypothetical protein
VTDVPATPAPALAFLSQYFDGVIREDHHDTAAYLVTTSDDGWPHAAMLSVGEIRVSADGAVHIALWPHTTTAANLVRDGRGLLLVAFPGVAVRARLSLQEIGTIDGGESGRLMLLAGVVELATVDDARYATVLSGTRFRLTDPQPTLERWRQTQALITRHTHLRNI